MTTVNCLSHNPRQRGVAMSETVLVLPIIMIVMVMLLFYGWSMMRLQRASVQDRYEAWREVYHAPGPKVTGATAGNARTRLINQTFWGGKALSMTYRRSDTFGIQLRRKLINQVRRRSYDAADLVEPLIEDRMPHGRTVGFTTQLSAFTKVADELNIPIKHRHTRIANEWKYVNAIKQRGDDRWVESGYIVAPQSTLRDVYLPHFDRRLQRIIGTSNGQVARVIRKYYLAKPKYRGPDVDYQFPNN